MKFPLLPMPFPRLRRPRRPLRSAFILHPSSFILLFLLSGCGHAPETAAELQKALPTQYQGELHLQGDPDPHRLVLEPHELSVREPHLLEFKQVRYQFFSGSAVAAEGDANIRGTISTPDLAIHIEQFSGEGAGDAMKPGSFQGKISKDLKEIEASWQSGYGQSVRLKAKSEP